MAVELKSAEERPAGADQQVRETVSEILLAIEREGDAAVRRYSERFDGWAPASFLVGEEEMLAAADLVEPELREQIDFARAQVSGFAEAQRACLADLSVKPLPGVELGHRNVPVDSVGSYSPGGLYPLIASSLMTIVTPRVAGVERVIACAPPLRGGDGIHPAQLYAMVSSGADQVLCIGGVQGMAAMAFGIEGIEAVDMIVGAGNAFVAEAKRQLFGRVGIDLLAGPTEILVIADDSSDPELVAVDLLGQAEHGPTSPAILVTDSEELGSAVIAAVGRRLATWPTAEVAGEAWRRCGRVLLCEDREEMAALANEIATEHLELQTRDDDWFLGRVHNYGTVFVGALSTVAYSDKAIGTNHVLPTKRAARYTGGLWVGNFLKTLSYQRVSADGTAAVAPATAAICIAEGMLGHAITAQVRMSGGADEYLGRA